MKLLVPNLAEKINHDNAREFISTARCRHIQYEYYLHRYLKELKEKEEKIKKIKINLENELKEIDETISDKEISFDILVNIDCFKKMFNKKMIKHYVNEFNKKEEKNLQLSNINISNNNSNFLRHSITTNTVKQNLMIKKNDNLNKKEKDENFKYFKAQHLLRAQTFKAKLNNIILKNNEQANQKAEQLEKAIDEEKINKKLIIENLKKINKKLKIVHINQKNIIDKLYIHYLSILKKGTDTREEGLSWVIYEILNLGKKVMMSYLPNYLDEKSVLYLFQMAHLMKKIRNLEQKYNELKKIFNKNIQMKKSISQGLKLKKYLESKKNLNDIKEKYLGNSYSLIDLTKENLITKQNIQKYISQPLSLRKQRTSIEFMAKAKKMSKELTTLFIRGDPNHYYEEENEVEIPKVIKFKDIDKYILKKSTILFEKAKDKVEKSLLLHKEIKKLKKEKEEMKNKEMERIFKEFRYKKYYEKYNVDKNTILNALIGEDNLKVEIYNQNKKEKQLNDDILKTRLFKIHYSKKNEISTNNISLNLNLRDNNFNILKNNENFNTIAQSKVFLEQKIKNVNNTSVIQKKKIYI